ncbi:hypothetical protein [Haloferax volcanii]|uniref:hypothetical protein n=1 Tax=Haloferax volcanii TaxID=2246 RepID=UPI00349FC54B
MSSDNKTMKRSKSKFVYDYLPRNTFNHAHNNLSGRVATLKAELGEHGEELEPDLPKAYLIERIHRHISKWPNDDDIRDDLTYANTELIQPGWANYVVYPLTFECDSCGSVTQFDRDQMDAMDEEGANVHELAVCQNPTCGASLSDRDQLPFVAVCECGEIDELNVPTCCGAGMEFNRPTTTMDSWYWSCAVNGSCDTKSFYGTPVYCPNGDCPNENMEVMNHTSSSAFYPQVRNLINVQPQLDDLHSSEHQQARYVSDYLLGDEGGSVDEHEQRRVANELLDGNFFDAPREEVDAKLKEAKERLMVNVQEHRNRTETWLQGDTPTDGDWPPGGYHGDATTLAEEIYEFLSVVSPDYAPASGIESVSYQEMVDNDADETHLSLAKVKTYNQLREALNFAEVRLIKDFPITQATYGYTRTDANPPGENRNPATSDGEEDGRRGDDGDTPDTDGDADMCDSDGDAEDGGIPVQLRLFTTGDYSAPQVFVQTNDAEAVLVQFDLEKVIEWLDENDLLDDAVPDSVGRPNTDSEEATRKWFVANIDPPGRYDELPDDAAPGTRECISRHCYTLLNTTAHLFINGMGALAGHQRESLVEHLMPRTMSFVVYKRPDTNFALGSVWTLFEEQFDDFAAHLDELYDCSYDPVCIHDENGACEDCLYLAAISTENANHNLGRGTFYGGNFDGRDLTGYKHISLDDGDA